MINDPKLAQMEEIWRLTTKTDQGWLRLNRSDEPWLIENALRYDGSEVRVTFEDGRRREDLPFWERKQRFTQARSYLYGRAVQARSKASSYRNFKVGTALLAFRSGYRHHHAWKVFEGMNIKMAGDARSTCSEPIAIGATVLGEYDLIIGMIVVGQPREEDVGVTKTLHPCQECRRLMHGYQHETRPDMRVIDSHTIIHTAMAPEHGGAGICEEMTLTELFDCHHHEDSKYFPPRP